MSELQELKSMLQAHMKESAEGQAEIKQAIARIEVHNEYSAKKLEDHDDIIDSLKSAHNKQKGVIWVLGAIGLTGLVEFIKNIFK